ncbi:hypothetical protein MP228_001764 [Amoeboaphelidium protococcarum]|nr:hypothetical protein MP228_001764 [Amoeboaphelidium protococcarum]
MNLNGNNGVVLPGTFKSMLNPQINGDFMITLLNVSSIHDLLDEKTDNSNGSGSADSVDLTSSSVGRGVEDKQVQQSAANAPLTPPNHALNTAPIPSQVTYSSVISRDQKERQNSNNNNNNSKGGKSVSTLQSNASAAAGGVGDKESPQVNVADATVNASNSLHTALRDTIKVARSSSDASNQSNTSASDISNSQDLALQDRSQQQQSQTLADGSRRVYKEIKSRIVITFKGIQEVRKTINATGKILAVEKSDIKQYEMIFVQDDYAPGESFFSVTFSKTLVHNDDAFNVAASAVNQIAPGAFAPAGQNTEKGLMLSGHYAMLRNYDIGTVRVHLPPSMMLNHLSSPAMDSKSAAAQSGGYDGSAVRNSSGAGGRKKAYSLSTYQIPTPPMSQQQYVSGAMYTHHQYPQQQQQQQMMQQQMYQHQYPVHHERVHRQTISGGYDPSYRYLMQSQGGTPHMSTPPQPTRYCYGCGDSGHLHKDCPRDQLFCYNCNQNGHSSKNCKKPKPWEMNQMQYHQSAATPQLPPPAMVTQSGMYDSTWNMNGLSDSLTNSAGTPNFSISGTSQSGVSNGGGYGSSTGAFMKSKWSPALVADSPVMTNSIGASSTGGNGNAAPHQQQQSQQQQQQQYQQQPQQQRQSQMQNLSQSSVKNAPSLLSSSSKSFNGYSSALFGSAFSSSGYSPLVSNNGNGSINSSNNTNFSIGSGNNFGSGSRGGSQTYSYSSPLQMVSEMDEELRLEDLQTQSDPSFMDQRVNQATQIHHQKQQQQGNKSSE